MRKMQSAVLMGACVLCVFVSLRPAGASPPPWTMEKSKTEAELVLLARVARVSKVKEKGRINTAATLEVLEVLKGELPGQTAAEKTPAEETETDKKKETTQRTVKVLFHVPEPPKGPRRIGRRVIGGTGNPRIVEGKTVLIFLNPYPEKKGPYYTVVAGSFGCKTLNVDSKEDLKGLKEDFERSRKYGRRLEDDDSAEALSRYYQLAYAVAGRLWDKKKEQWGEQGVMGKVVKLKGNLMPSPDRGRLKTKAMGKTLTVPVHIFRGKVEPFEKPDPDHPKLVEVVQSDEDGYRCELEPGEYTIVAVIEGKMYLNSYTYKNKKRRWGSVEVEEGEWKTVNIRDTSEAAF